MRFVSLAGALQRARRYVSGSPRQDVDVDSLDKLGDILRQMSKRIAVLEALSPPESLEIEIQVGTAGASISLAHNFGSPVRWWVVGWSGVIVAPVLVQNVASTNNVLVLRSYASGRAIIRIEPSQYTATL